MSSYGIEINSGNGNVQIDTNTTGKGLIVIDSGTASQTSRRVDLEKELVFARPTATSGQNYMAVTRSTMNAAGEQFLYFKKSNGTALNVDYVIAKVASEQTQSSSGYGVQVFNTEGDLTFDSGLFTGDGGIGVTDFIAAYAGSGNDDYVTSDTSKYALVNSTNYAANTEVGVNLAYYYVKTTNLRYTTTGVYFYGAFQFQFQGEPIDFAAIPNLGAILMAEVGSV